MMSAFCKKYNYSSKEGRLFIKNKKVISSIFFLQAWTKFISAYDTRPQG